MEPIEWTDMGDGCWWAVALAPNEGIHAEIRQKGRDGFMAYVRDKHDGCCKLIGVLDALDTAKEAINAEIEKRLAEAINAAGQFLANLPPSDWPEELRDAAHRMVDAERQDAGDRVMRGGVE